MNRYEQRIKNLSPEKQELLARRLSALQKDEIQNGSETHNGLRLIAYLAVSDQVLTAAELRSFLGEKLPAYMIPAQYVFLESMPQTPNGKIDRQALPAIEAGPTQKSEYTSVQHSSLEEEIIRVWTALLGFSEIDLHDNFFELGGHSLLVTRMIAQLRQSQQVEIPVSIFFQNPTVAGLARQIQKAKDSTKQNSLLSEGFEKPAPEPSASIEMVTTDLDEPADGRTWESLIPIRTRGSRPPFYGIHAITGQILFWRHLVQYLNPEQPFYALQARGLDGLRPPRTSIPEMAAAYIQEMRTVQPKGPYYMGGYSMGGEIAFEIAQQLTKAGEEVGLLVLFDTSNPIRAIRKVSQPAQNATTKLPGRRLPLVFYKITGHLERLSKLSWPDRGKYLTSDLGMRVRRLKIRAYVKYYWSQKKRLPDWLIDAYVDQCHMHAVINYAPVHYPGKITLFRARQSLETSPLDDPYGWAPLVNDIDLYLFDSNHEIVNAAYAKDVANQLNICLDQSVR
jgi:thioesterase domain-containing protein/acyl carrier protein